MSSASTALSTFRSGWLDKNSQLTDFGEASSRTTVIIELILIQVRTVLIHLQSFKGRYNNGNYQIIKVTKVHVLSKTLPVCINHDDKCFYLTQVSLKALHKLIHYDINNLGKYGDRF